MVPSLSCAFSSWRRKTGRWAPAGPVNVPWAATFSSGRREGRKGKGGGRAEWRGQGRKERESLPLHVRTLSTSLTPSACSFPTHPTEPHPLATSLFFPIPKLARNTAWWCPSGLPGRGDNRDAVTSATVFRAGIHSAICKTSHLLRAYHDGIAVGVSTRKDDFGKECAKGVRHEQDEEEPDHVRGQVRRQDVKVEGHHEKWQEEPSHGDEVNKI